MSTLGNVTLSWLSAKARMVLDPSRSFSMWHFCNEWKLRIACFVRLESQSLRTGMKLAWTDSKTMQIFLEMLSQIILPSMNQCFWQQQCWALQAIFEVFPSFFYFSILRLSFGPMSQNFHGWPVSHIWLFVWFFSWINQLLLPDLESPVVRLCTLMDSRAIMLTQ